MTLTECHGQLVITASPYSAVPVFNSGSEIG